MSIQSGASLPPVGILAPSTALAESLARELHIAKPVKLSPKTIKGGALRDKRLGALLVDESVWPLEPVVTGHVLAALARYLGSVLLVRRIDAKVKPGGTTVMTRVAK